MKIENYLGPHHAWCVKTMRNVSACVRVFSLPWHHCLASSDDQASLQILTEKLQNWKGYQLIKKGFLKGFFKYSKIVGLVRNYGFKNLNNKF